LNATWKLQVKWSGFLLPKQNEMKERKAFKFYRSYFEVANELPDKERLEFLWALLKKQFENVDSDLTGLARFAYVSQEHSIKAQMEGYISKVGNPTQGGAKGGTKGGSEAPEVQEKEKEKVQEKEEIIDFGALLLFVNNSFERKFKVVSDKARKQYNARLKEGYTKADITTAINNCKKNQYHMDNNYQYCTIEFFSRAETLEKYSDTTKQQKVIQAFHPIIIDN